MKYTLTRQFSLNSEKFEVVCDAKSVCTVRATASKDFKGRFNVTLAEPGHKYTGEDYCLVEPDPEKSQNYLIYAANDQKNAKVLFGELLVQPCSHNNYQYTIIIGQKLYQVRSCDLKDRRLAIVDAVKVNSSSNVAYPELLYQVIDSFSKSNKKYHVNIHDKEWPLGYLAITVLLDLHESKRS